MIISLNNLSENILHSEGGKLSRKVLLKTAAWLIQ